MTKDFGGEDLARLSAVRGLLRSEISALARFVRRLHESGLRDPDLLARNILVSRSSDGISFAKIDSSSARFLRPGAAWDASRIRDLETLIADLASRRRPGWELLRLLVLQWFPGPRPFGRRFSRRLLAAARGGG